MLLGILFITGLTIVLFPHVAQQFHKHVQKSHAEQLIEKYELADQVSLDETKQEFIACNEAIFLDDSTVHDPFTEHYRLHDIVACKQITFHDEAFAVLEIPTLSLLIPIYLGASEEQLRKGIGQVEGSSLPIGGKNTHTVLAGHRGMGTKTMFRHLDQMKRGDLFYIHTLSETLTYEVFDIEVIIPTDTNNMHIEEDRDLASLITCHPYRHNSHRLVVHGERKER